MTKQIMMIANWKMNPSKVRDAIGLAKESTKEKVNKDIKIVLAAPTIFLESLVKSVKKVHFSAQNCASFPSGPYTGEVSAAMLASIGVKYVILGHSERRALKETNQDIAEKVAQAIKSGLTPILCVGEKERDQTGFYLHEVKAQLETCLSQIPKSKIDNVVIAYEPVWAISSQHGRETTPAEFLEMMLFIRKVVTDMSGVKAHANMPIIYGGSANDKNILQYLEAGAGGFLVGHASLDPKKFSKMIEITREFLKKK
jgi:triosephosphate isomerase